MKRHAVEIDTLHARASHERASATPERRGRATTTSKRSSAVVPAPVGIEDAGEGDASLRGRQLRFACTVTTPESRPGLLDGAGAARWFTDGPRMTALDRLDVYRRAYHSRLVDCLVDDYPAIQHALGEAAFEELCRGYIAAFPSTGPNLNYFGRRMGEFVRERMPEPFPLRAFVADLAALEWAIVEVIHSASAPPLTADGLRDVPPGAWGDLRLEATRAFGLLRFAYPVNAYFQAFRDHESPTLPLPESSAAVVYRGESTMWRMELTEPMAEVLSALVAGEPLGEALGRAEAGLSHLDEAELASLVTHWFREWVGHGLFVRARW